MLIPFEYLTVDIRTKFVGLSFCDASVFGL